MSVTRDVSQLRGWLNLIASCGGSQAGALGHMWWAMWCTGSKRQAGRRGGAVGAAITARCAPQHAQREVLATADWGTGTGGGSSARETVAHSRTRVAGRGVRAGRREAVCTHSMQGRGHDCRLGGRARGSTAHDKHQAHVRDAGRVQAEGLVELVRALPRVAQAGGTHCGVRGECGGPGGGRRRPTAGCVLAACTVKRGRAVRCDYIRRNTA